VVLGELAVARCCVTAESIVGAVAVGRQVNQWGCRTYSPERGSVLGSRVRICIRRRKRARMQGGQNPPARSGLRGALRLQGAGRHCSMVIQSRILLGC
jgi:hypothetical protein